MPACIKRPLNWFQFRDRYCLCKASPYHDGVKVVGVKQEMLPELRDKLAGFSLRRLKRDHLSLPPIRWGTTVVTSDTALPKELVDIERELKGKTDVLAALRDEVEFSTWRRLCGVAKAPAAVELLVDELENSTKKVVVFAHHTEVVEILAEGLAQFGVVKITGATSAKERQNAVDVFQASPGVRVAICQIVAGGVGITLTAASDVVFVEASFVPGDNDQAACRCHRIGQTQPVLVRMLSLAGSVDELVAEILTRKSAMIAQVVGA
jgi:SWI/SNF-related matrix-associated actin-dependent regulator 1 of chromatin subfamily A